MARYVARSKAVADCDWWDAGRLYDTVEVTESEPTDTGLLDNHGNSIWRMNDPIGFQF